MSKIKSNTNMPNCSKVDSMWKCFDEFGPSFDQYFMRATHMAYTFTAIAFVLCSINAIVCYNHFNQTEYKSRAIPVVLRMKYVFSLLTVAFYLLSTMAFIHEGFHLPVITSLPVCTLVFFLYNFFTISYNWAELFSSLLRYTRSTQLTESQYVYFQNKTLGHFAVLILTLLSFALNIKIFLFQYTDLCRYLDRAYCSTFRQWAVSNCFMVIVGHVIPYVGCLIMLLLMTISRREFIRESHNVVDPIFQRAYIFCFSTTVAFVGTNIFWVIFSGFGLSGWNCHDGPSYLIPAALAIGVRHLGFSLDWLIFLGISPLFRYQAKRYIQSKLRIKRHALK